MTSGFAERLRRLLLGVLLVLGPGAAVADANAEFPPEEVARIAGHGPWPPPWRGDPGNRASGSPAAIRLGYRLFFDPQLSPTGKVSCASCHRPDLGFQDGRATARGLRHGVRNTPGLWNVRHQRWLGWDGGHDNLWSASLRPILDAGEMGGSAVRTARRIRADRDLACHYRQAFGRAAAASDAAFLANVAKALAAWQETLVSPPTAFDAFRDALTRGDMTQAGRYPAAARRGLKIFLGPGQCATCHAGPMFSNGEFADIGVPFFIKPAGVDPGRQAGIKRLLENHYNLLGAFNDDTSRENAAGIRYLRAEHRNFGEFKVPSLRNLTLTAPYMHNGRLATLRDVVRHYSELDEDRLHSDGERILKPLNLDAGQIDDLVAFLESLSPPVPVASPTPPGPITACRPG